jgi:hypothetical protein
MDQAQVAARGGPLTEDRARALVGGRLFDWLVIGGMLWLVTALGWDGWAHIQRLPDSFWTVWHAALYAGYGALATVFLGAIAWNRPIAGSWRAAIPAGYGWAAVGAPVFAAGGFADMIWHTTFGIELSSDALLSPTHVVLATGVFLMVTGPLRADWARGDRDAGLIARLPMVLSLTAALNVFTFMTLFAGPNSEIFGAGQRGSSGLLERQLLGVYLYSSLLVAVALTAIRHGPLPLGTFTLFIGLNGLGSILMHGRVSLDVQLLFIAVAFAAGAVMDLLAVGLHPSVERPGRLRLFAFAAPLAYFAIYLSAVVASFPVWWSVHALFGVPVLAGVAGLLISYLVVAPSVARAA